MFVSCPSIVDKYRVSFGIKADVSNSLTLPIIVTKPSSSGGITSVMTPIVFRLVASVEALASLTEVCPPTAP